MRISDWSSDVCSSDLRRGSIAERNGDRYSWVNQLDVSFQQELPGFFKGHKSVIRLDIYNFLNLLDSDWGETMGETFSDNTRYLARLASVNADGTYTYNLGSDSSPTWRSEEHTSELQSLMRTQST